MPTQMDIIKVGSRYQVYKMQDNSPCGPTYATRREAEDYMYQMMDEEYRDGMFGMGMMKASPEQSAANSVELAQARAKVSSSRTVGDSPANKAKVS